MEGVFKGSKSRGILNASDRHDWNLVMIELGRGRAQLGESKEAFIYDSAFVEPEKVQLEG